MGSATIKRYGILNTTVAETNPLYGYPFPGTFILNRDGVVTSRVFEPTYQERRTISSVFADLGGKVDTPVTKTAAPHLEITSYLTDRVAAPGTRFSIVLDIRPEPRVHVYAPTVTGYKPIALAVQPQAGLIVRDAQFPKAEDYFFKPLNEHVPVFQKPFRIVQDVEIDPSREAASTLKDMKTMTIGGTLNYQACDDKVCFNPQSVPLSWIIDLRPLDTERASKGRPRSIRSDLTFITRDGCVNSPDMFNNLDDALRALGLPLDYQVVNLGTLPKTDPRTGYPTPTLLYKNRDLFGMPEPTPPYPEPS